MIVNPPTSIDETLDMLRKQDYVCDRSLATLAYLSLTLNRPMFLEGEAGVGKTELAKSIASGLGRDLIRLQCYEGMDASTAVYEWNFAAQMLAMRAEGEKIISTPIGSCSSALYCKQWKNIKTARLYC